MTPGRCGFLFSTNDDFIRALIKDPNYRMKKTGEIQTRITRTGKVGKNWRLAGGIRDKYHRLTYKRKKLLAHRIIYQKYNGELATDLVISHKDNNSLNNKSTNLKLVTQANNNKNAYKDGHRKPVKGNRKIDQKTTDQIRDYQKEGWTNRELRNHFKLAKSTISYIINHRTWKGAKRSEGAKLIY